MIDFKAIAWPGRDCRPSPSRPQVSKLCACVMMIVIATIMGGEPVSADDTQMRMCSAKLVDRRHADPAVAEQVCGCLFQLLPADTAAGVATALVAPDAEVSGVGETVARLRAECRAKACASPTPIDDSCDFDAAWAAAAQRDHVAAIERYSRFIKAHPDLPGAISNRGRSYLETGSYELAIADLEKAVAMMGSRNNSDLYLAHAYHLAGRDQDAAAIIDEAVKANWSNPYSALFRAEIREALGRRNDAIADYREALKMSMGQSDIREAALAGLKRLGAE
jgi:hypothetical protein